MSRAAALAVLLAAAAARADDGPPPACRGQALSFEKIRERCRCAAPMHAGGPDRVCTRTVVDVEPRLRDDLEVAVEPAAPTVASGRKLAILLRLRNTGDRPLLIPLDREWTPTFRVRDAGGAELEPLPSRDCPDGLIATLGLLRAAEVVLPPGGELTARLTFTARREEARGQCVFPDPTGPPLPPGDYDVEIRTPVEAGDVQPRPGKTRVTVTAGSSPRARSRP